MDRQLNGQTSWWLCFLLTWASVGGACNKIRSVYLYCSPGATWTSAYQDCVQQGMTLLKPWTQTEYDDWVSYLDNQGNLGSLWVAARWNSTINAYQWEGDTRTVTGSWSYYGGCVSFVPGSTLTILLTLIKNPYTFDSSPCSDSKGYICQPVVATTTVSTTVPITTPDTTTINTTTVATTTVNNTTANITTVYNNTVDITTADSTTLATTTVEITTTDARVDTTLVELSTSTEDNTTGNTNTEENTTTDTTTEETTLAYTTTQEITVRDTTTQETTMGDTTTQETTMRDTTTQETTMGDTTTAYVQVTSALSTNVVFTTLSTTLPTTLRDSTAITTDFQIGTEVTLEMNSSFIEKASTSVEVTTSLEVTTALEVTTSDDFCSCGCPWIIPSGVELRAYVEQVVVEQIHQALQVDTETLSSTIRQKVSVEDGRRSAKAVGFVGIVVIVFVFGSVLLLDMTSCASFMQTRVKKKRRPSDGKVTPE